MSAVCDGVTLRSHCTGGPGGELPSAIVHNIKTIEQKNVFFFDFASLFDSRFCRFSVYRFQFRSSKVYKTRRCMTLHFMRSRCTDGAKPMPKKRIFHHFFPILHHFLIHVSAGSRCIGFNFGRPKCIKRDDA